MDMFKEIKDVIKSKITDLLVNTFGVSGLARYFATANFEDGVAVSTENAYRNHAYVNICVNKIATNVTRAPLEILDGDKVVTTGAVYNLFRDVNQQMSRAQLVEATLSWILTRGESIWVLVRDGVFPSELHVYDPIYFKHFVSKEKDRIVLWKYEKDGASVPFLPDDIIHFAMWNPWNRFRGVNPLVAQESEITKDIIADRNDIALLKNRAVPSGLLTSDQSITEPQAKDIIDRWNLIHGGDNKHKVGVLGSGTKFQALNLSPADMEFYSMKKWNRAVILGRYGVPPLVAGFKDESTALSGSDAAEQLKFFWETTILSYIRFFEDKLASEFTARFAPKLKLKFNILQIPELQENINKEHERIRLDVKQGLLTQNEGRELMGHAPVVWGNTWWRPISLVSVTEKEKKEDSENKKLAIFDKQLSVYGELYKNKHWWSVINIWDEIENGLKDKLQEWMQAQRADVLKELAGSNGKLTRKFNKEYWNKQRSELKSITDMIIQTASEEIMEGVKQLLKDTGIEDTYLEHLDKVYAPDNQIVRLYDALLIYLADSIKNRDMDEVRKRYKITQARLKIISHVEVGRVINRVRIDAYKIVGINDHEWLSARDDSKNSNELDGEVVRIGDKFSNGLQYPFDIVTDDIENFESCLTLPVIRGDNIGRSENAISE